jgi:hypothetical protein
MLVKPSNYDEIQVNQEFERLELGGHKGIIKSIEEYTSTISGNTSLKVEVDTATDDKQPNYFQKQYDENTNADKRWSSSGTKYVSLKQDDNCIKMLKGFITSVENSNNGFTYDWNKDVDQLKGKKVGLVFGLEEYENDKGETKTATKLTQFRSVDKVDNAKIPNVRLLNGSYIEYDKYNSNTTTNNSNPFEGLEDVVEIGDNFLD